MKLLTTTTRVSNFNIHPKNWESPDADINIVWYLSYRFYDDELNKSKPVKIQSLNKFSSLKERQKLIRQIIKIEEEMLFRNLYNPITGRYADIPDYEIPPLRIDEVSTRHLKRILVWLKDNRKKFGASSYNHYIKFMNYVYRKLIELETVDNNKARDLMKMKALKKVLVSFWKKHLEDITDPEFYIFSDEMIPGEKPIKAAWPTLLWKRHVKHKLGINKDLYKLKHLNSTENFRSVQSTRCGSTQLAHLGKNGTSRL